MVLAETPQKGFAARMKKRQGKKGSKGTSKGMKKKEVQNSFIRKLEHSKGGEQQARPHGLEP